MDPWRNVQLDQDIVSEVPLGRWESAPSDREDSSHSILSVSKDQKRAEVVFETCLLFFPEFCGADQSLNSPHLKGCSRCGPVNGAVPSGIWLCEKHSVENFPCCFQEVKIFLKCQIWNRMKKVIEKECLEIQLAFVFLVITSWDAHLPWL